MDAVTPLSWKDRVSDYESRVQKMRRARNEELMFQISQLNIIPHVLLHGIEHKSCSSCGSLKPLSEFHCKSDKYDGLSSACKKCVSSRRKGNR
jgi:hypothetical protein